MLRTVLAIVALAATAPHVAAEEKIFFHTARDAAAGERHIWWMNPDGTGIEQLTFGAVHDVHAELSPDGGRLVFQRGLLPGARECYAIVVLDLATRVEQIVVPPPPTEPLTSFEPTWSPLGDRIAFTRATPGAGCAGVGPGSPRTWVVDYLDGQNTLATAERLSPASGAARQWPSWSTDGTNILCLRLAGDSTASGGGKPRGQSDVAPAGAW